MPFPFFRVLSPILAEAKTRGGTAIARTGTGLESFLNRLHVSKELFFETATSPKVRAFWEAFGRKDVALQKNMDHVSAEQGVELKYTWTRDRLWGGAAELNDDNYAIYRARIKGRIDSGTESILAGLKREATENGLDAARIYGKRHYLNRAEWNSEISFARRRTNWTGYNHPVPEINRLAKHYGDELFEPVDKMGAETGIISEAIQKNESWVKSYLSQIWKPELVRERRQYFIDLVKQNSMINVRRAQNSVLEEVTKRKNKIASMKSSGKKTEKAEATLAKYEKKLAGYQNYDPTKYAEKTVDEIIQSPYGIQGDEFDFLGEAKFQKSRKLHINQELLSAFEPFMENDIEQISHVYLRSMLPRIFLKERFGEVELKKVMEEIQDEYTSLRESPGLTDREKKNLDIEQRRALRYMRALRDEFTGFQRLPSDPYAITTRISRSILQLNFLRSLGGVAPSSTPDISRHIARFGLSRSLNLLGNWMAHPEIVKMGLTDAKKVAGIYEIQTGQRAYESAELGRNLLPYETSVERLLDKATDKAGKLFLINYWNQYNKQFAGFLAMDMILESAQNIRMGRAVDHKMLARLAESGLDADDLKKIWTQFEKHGFEESGIKVSQAGKWSDKASAEKFSLAVKRETDIAIVTPGFGSRPFLGAFEPISKHLLQFRSFSFTSTQAILLSGLQYKDAQVLNQLVLGVTIGALVYGLKEWQSTGKWPVDVGLNEWIAQGIDRSGVLGIVADMSAAVERVSRGNIGINPLLGASRASRFKTLDAVNLLGGPTVSLVRDVGNAMSGAITLNPTNQSISSFRRSIPYQNLFYIRFLFDKFEEGMKKTLVEPTGQKKRKIYPGGF